MNTSSTTAVQRQLTKKLSLFVAWLQTIDGPAHPTGAAVDPYLQEDPTKQNLRQHAIATCRFSFPEPARIFLKMKQFMSVSLVLALFSDSFAASDLRFSDHYFYFLTSLCAESTSASRPNLRTGISMSDRTAIGSPQGAPVHDCEPT